MIGAPGEHGAGDVAEVLRVGAPRAHLQELDALLDLGDVVAAAAEQGAQAHRQGFDLAGQDAGVDFLEQLLHCQQGIGFAAVEPEAGQFMLRPGVPGVLGPGAALWFEPVAAAEAVPHDGGVEAVAQVSQAGRPGRA